MADNTQYTAQLAAFDKQAEDYIGQLLDGVQGDRDLAIRMLTRDHDLAIGSNDAQTAAFLESVSDKLEEKIGRIPYDYEIATKRIGENLDRTTEVTNRNKDLALSRLAEDEKVWREQFGRDTAQVRQGQNESLSERGILQGKRSDAQGLASREIGKTEGDITSTLSAYDRALGRSTSDIKTQASDTLFDANREATRGKQDEGTIARRGVIDVQDATKFGKEAEERKAKQRQLELERQLANLKNMGTTYATTGVI